MPGGAVVAFCVELGAVGADVAASEGEVRLLLRHGDVFYNVVSSRGD